MSAGRFLAPCLALLLLAGCNIEQNVGEVGYKLPSGLTEVSGLALAGPDSVFAHDDTHAIIYEIRLRDGRMQRAFALGDPTIEGDFEGIDAVGGKVFLISSDGVIYAATPGKNGERVPFDIYDSGVGKNCEVEGLSNSPEPGNLLILCKRLRVEEDQPKLEIYQWRIGAERAGDKPWLSVPYDQLLEERQWSEFGPSALEWDPVAGHFFVASAHNRLLLVLDRQGRLIKQLPFNQSRHPKVEGITITPDRRMAIADEGSRARNGQLTIFPLPEF